MDLVIKNVNVVDSIMESKEHVDIIIKDGKIQGIVNTGVANILPGTKIIDGSGLTAMPGLIDAHCHLREPGLEYKEDIASGTASAAKGGFTSIACMPNTKPVADNSAIISFIVEKAKKVGAVNVFPIGAISKGSEGKELAEIGDMKECGAIAISDDGKPVISSSLMKKAMVYAQMFDMPVISHCEDVDLADDGYMNEGYNSTKMGLRGITRAAEEVMVSRDLILAEATSAPIHIAHVSTRLSVELVRQSKKRGVKATCETCPHYFTLTDDACLDFNTSAKVNPPLREQDDVDAIIEGLKDGTIDMIVTDHAPHHQDEKNVEFATAANGISGFETAFGLSYTYLVEKGYLTLKQLVEKMSYNPSKFLKLSRGLLQDGSISDIVLVNLDDKYKVDVSKFVSKGKNSPYNGYELKGSIVATIVGGRIVYMKG